MPDIALEPATRILLKNTTADVNRTSFEADDSKERAALTEEAKPAVAIVSDEIDEPTPSEESIREAVEKLQGYADQLNRDLEFSVDDSSGRTVVTVRDGSTEEVIRQIPSEEALRIADDVDNGGVRLLDARA